MFPLRHLSRRCLPHADIAEDVTLAHPSYAQDHEDEVAELVVELEVTAAPSVEDVVEGDEGMEKYIRK